jgi:macrolide transport system ATP-binding/permease protein
MIPLFRKLDWLFQRRRKEAELREELDFHLSVEAGLHEEAGLAHDAAKAAARRELGNLGLVQEDTRSTWGWSFLDQLVQDLRYAFRAMKSNRLFTLLAMLTLALGIGANTAIYSFLDAILVRTLPVADPQSLIAFKWHSKTQRDSVLHGMSTGASSDTYDDPQTGTIGGIFPYPAFELVQKQNNDSMFTSVFAFESAFADSLNVSVKGEPGLQPGVFVSGEFFSGLGVSPVAGRLILPGDDQTGVPAVAVVSHSMSQARLGGPANAIGQSILVDNVPFIVIGVTPQGFFGVDPRYNPSIYLPFRSNLLLGAANPFGLRPNDYLAQNFYWVQIMARLRPGVSAQQAQAALVEPFHQWVSSTATNDLERNNLPQLRVKPAATGLDSLRRDYSQPLYLLLGMVVLILLLACANVANLLLARAAARRREIALRLSIGAGRWRLIRQLLTESILLASSSGILGLLFAFGGIRFLTLLLANGRNDFPVRAELNCHVLAAALALSLLTGITFGLVPALQATKVDVLPSLKESRETRGITRRGFRRLSLSNVLVASQIAVSMLLLVAAGLFLRTLSNLQSIPLGFNRENVLLFQLNALKVGHKDTELFDFYEGLRRQFSEMPGVNAATVSEGSIVAGETGLPLTIGKVPVGPERRIWSVGPHFFRTMQIPILAGRDFDEHDRPATTPVTVINEKFAKAYFPGRNPLGEHIQLLQGGDTQSVARDMEIVGVSRDARYGSLTQDIPPVAYILFDQAYPRQDRAEYALRTSGDPLSYAAAVWEIVRRVDSRIPVSEIKTQVADIDQTISQQIALAKLCSGFAILALTIACVGLFGTVSYNVARRTSEIGIRMALGAQRGKVIRMVLREVSFLAAAGVVVGLAAALATSKFVESFLYEIKRNDPLSLSAAVLILLGAAFLGAYAPAHRASRIDPMVALRHE